MNGLTTDKAALIVYSDFHKICEWESNRPVIESLLARMKEVDPEPFTDGSCEWLREVEETEFGMLVHILAGCYMESLDDDNTQGQYYALSRFELPTFADNDADGYKPYFDAIEAITAMPLANVKAQVAWGELPHPDMARPGRFMQETVGQHVVSVYETLSSSFVSVDVRRQHYSIDPFGLKDAQNLAMYALGKFAAAEIGKKMERAAKGAPGVGKSIAVSAPFDERQWLVGSFGADLTLTVMKQQYNEFLKRLKRGLK